MMNWMRRKWKKWLLIIKRLLWYLRGHRSVIFSAAAFLPFLYIRVSVTQFCFGKKQIFSRGAGICRCFCLHCYCTDALLDFYHSCAGIHITGQAAVHVILLYMVHQFVRQAMEAFHFHRLVRGKKDIGYERNPVQRRS